MEYKLTSKRSDHFGKAIKTGIDMVSAATLLALYFVMLAAFVSVISSNPPLNAKQIREIPVVAPSPVPSQTARPEAWSASDLGAE